MSRSPSLSPAGSAQIRKAPPSRLWPWRITVFVAALLPLLWWAWQVASQQAGPEPGRYLLEHLGRGALILLLLTLCLTPLSQLTRWRGFTLIRRQLGLWTFSYALIHLACYLLFILGLNLHGLLGDLTRRPYIIVGMLALLGLTAMAVTSNRWAMRRLGRRWKSLHRVVYLVLLLGLLHFFWIVRADLSSWAGYAVPGLLLLLLRLPPVARRLNSVRPLHPARQPG